MEPRWSGDLISVHRFFIKRRRVNACVISSSVTQIKMEGLHTEPGRINFHQCEVTLCTTPITGRATALRTPLVNWLKSSSASVNWKFVWFLPSPEPVADRTSPLNGVRFLSQPQVLSVAFRDGNTHRETVSTIRQEQTSAAPGASSFLKVLLAPKLFIAPL